MTSPPTDDLATRIRALRDLGVPDLRRAFEAACGRTSRSDNREYLTHQIVRALCAAHPPTGRNARRAAARATQAALAPRRTGRDRPHDPRVPPVGSTLRRRHDGREIEVRVVRDGFVHAGRLYASLSAIAKEVTGAHWNGLLWFGLRPRQRGGPAS